MQLEKDLMSCLIKVFFFNTLTTVTCLYGFVYGLLKLHRFIIGINNLAIEMLNFQSEDVNS